MTDRHAVTDQSDEFWVALDKPRGSDEGVASDVIGPPLVKSSMISSADFKVSLLRERSALQHAKRT